MLRTPKKVLELIKLRTTNQSRVAAAIGMDGSQFSRWLQGRGNLTVERLLALARHLETSVEYLIDDAMAEEPVTPKDEEYLLKVYRDLKADPAQGLDEEGAEAVRRLSLPPERRGDVPRSGPPSIVPAPGTSPADVAAREADRKRPRTGGAR